jgi:hypothetical protein
MAQTPLEKDPRIGVLYADLIKARTFNEMLACLLTIVCDMRFFLVLSRLLIAISAIFCELSCSWASDATYQDTPAAPQSGTQPSVPDYLRQITDWNGLRSTLERAGLKFTFTYYGDAFANPIGGVEQGLGYDGRFGTIIDADLRLLR